MTLLYDRCANNLLLELKGNYPAREHSNTQCDFFSFSITAPRSGSSLVCPFHFLIHFVSGFTLITRFNLLPVLYLFALVDTLQNRLISKTIQEYIVISILAALI